MYDIITIGGGPAALSAAITARARNKTVAVISADYRMSGLYKAPEILNYPGLPAISGSELLERMIDHARAMGAELLEGRTVSVIPGETFFVSYGQEYAEGKSLILSTGIVQTNTFPGEAELLGRGVSYCATCDGMLYRGKEVCVVCAAPDAESEADYLSSIGCRVTKLKTNRVTVNGSAKVESVTADGQEIPCDAVFILRRSIAPATLLPGLKLAGGHIAVNARMETSIPGVFAAGDCTGQPYQISKAAGEGQVAALTAVEYLSR